MLSDEDYDFDKVEGFDDLNDLDHLILDKTEKKEVVNDLDDNRRNSHFNLISQVQKAAGTSQRKFLPVNRGLSYPIEEAEFHLIPSFIKNNDDLEDFTFEFLEEDDEDGEGEKKAGKPGKAKKGKQGKNQKKQNQKKDELKRADEADDLNLRLMTHKNKLVAKQAKRTVLYEEATKDMNKWNSIVYHNRTAEQLVYPFNDGKKIPKASFRTAAVDFVPKNALEEDMARILYGEEYLRNLKEKEAKAIQEAEANKYSLTFDEALAQHKESARFRALQSYAMIKAKRQGKIKSKKYHRLLKRDKIKKQLKEFEELQKKDPEAALDKLKELNHARIEERMNLKHRNTSKWAKSQAIRAKYNKDARLALTEQLQLSRTLTKKVQESSSEDEDEDALQVPALVKASMDNPWMLDSSTKDNDKIQLYYTGYKAYWEEVNKHKEKQRLEELKKQESDSVEVIVETPDDEEAEDPFALLPDDADDAEEDTDMDISVKSETVGGATSQSVRKEKRKEALKLKRKLKKLLAKEKLKKVDLQGKSPAEYLDKMFKKAEEKAKKQVKKNLKDILRQETFEKKTLERKQAKALKGQKRKLTDGDEGEIRDLNVNEEVMNLEVAPGEQNEEPKAQSSKKRRKDVAEKTDDDKTPKSNELPAAIDPSNFLKLNAKNSKFDGSGVELEDLDDEEDMDGDAKQRMIIAEAFEDDDVVAEFKAKKDEEVEASKPKDIDLSLPGWGEWCGPGITVSAKKKKKFFFKAPPAPPRKDANLPHVILNEKANSKLREHQVRELPFPFTRVKDYEKIIRAPIGRTWLSENAMKSLTAPKVITRLGQSIKPMDEDVLVKKNIEDLKHLKNNSITLTIPNSLSKFSKA